MAQTIEGDMDGRGMKFGIVVSRFNSLVTNELLSGALDMLARHGAREADQVIVRVPGGWEIPIVARALARKGGIDGIIALGCVMKGQTSHDEHIAAEVSKGLAAVSAEFDLPVCHGVLTPGTLEQALERAGMKMGNKGAEAAAAAIEIVNVLRAMKG
jgi:6,7-dimethyl-8-ribityllumazine synthase